MKKIKLLVLFIVIFLGALTTLTAQNNDCQRDCRDNFEFESSIFYNEYQNCFGWCVYYAQNYNDSGWSTDNCEYACDSNLNWSLEFAYIAYDNCLDYCD